MEFSRRALTVATVVLLLGVAGVGVWWRITRNSGAQAAGGAGANAGGDASGVEVGAALAEFGAALPQPVSGAAVVRDTLWITVNAAGQAAAFRRTTVTAQVEGVVTAIPVRENGRVGSGDVLLRTDTLDPALEAAEARAALADARAQFQARILFDDEITDPEVRRRREEVARSASGLNAAEVRLQQAELRLARATVRAPFPGRVADLRVVEGTYLTPGTELMTIVELDPIKVEVQVLEAELGYLEEGRGASVTFAAFPGETFRGRIATVNPVVDPEQRTGRVTVFLPNPDSRIKPGMYAEVSLDARSFPDRILVPREAVLERGEGRRRNMVFVYNETEPGRGRAEWRYVVTGMESDSLVEIVVPSDEGEVRPGEIVLVDGHFYIAHDTPVRLVENVAAAGGRPGR
ncbi:MAG: efflux RND transporter periplasmic adaptor subunit [Longimicrobiales bacterium]|nr:efflux RND transporter periplasmic adaptor subunit [Longimicrobiales bacterium]